MPTSMNSNTWGHILTGIFFWVVGAMALLNMAQGGKKTWSKFCWPVLAMVMGGIGFGFNESWLWSTGAVSWYETLQYPHVLQHRLAALGICFAGLVELLRKADYLTDRLWSLVFVGVSAGVGVMLLLHPAHAGVMEPMNMELHQHEVVSASTSMQDTPAQSSIRVQHQLMAAMCFLIALSGFLAEYRNLKNRWMSYAWPVFALLLGTLLVLYRE